MCEALFAKGYRHAYLGGGGYGEPLLAADIYEVAHGLRTLGFEQVTLVTNGTLLRDACKKLADAGVTAANISLDTIDERIYAWLCGKSMFPSVVAGIEEASRVFGRVKVITVLLKGINDIEVRDIMDFCKARRVELQINDLVNLDPSSSFYDTHYLDPSYLLEELDRACPHVEIIKLDSKQKFYLPDLTVTVRLTKAFTNFAIREDSPIIRPDGKMVWLSHGNVIFDLKSFKEKYSLEDKATFSKQIDAAIDNRLNGLTSEMLHQISICGSFSRASW
jgi:cyclic pyranopterin phosphate synthase